jgi:hypothetical protein
MNRQAAFEGISFFHPRDEFTSMLQNSPTAIEAALKY